MIKTFILTPENIGQLWGAVKESIKAIFEKKPVKLTIQPHCQRSLKQNNYYWGVVVPNVRAMFLDCGDVLDADEVHDYLKKHVMKLRRTVNGPEGEKEIIGSTKKLDTGPFEDQMHVVRAWAAQFGYMIPLPREGDDALDN